MILIAEITAKRHGGAALVGFETGRSAHYEGLAAGAADLCGPSAGLWQLPGEDNKNMPTYERRSEEGQP